MQDDFAFEMDLEAPHFANNHLWPDVDIDPIIAEKKEAASKESEKQINDDEETAAESDD